MKGWKYGWIISLVILTLLLSGCLFGSGKESSTEVIDPPQEDYLSSDEIEFEFDDGMEEEGTREESSSDEKGEEKKDEARAKLVDRTIYVFDHEGHVVPLTIKVPHTEGVAKQALEYLVVDGPVTDQLPDGMRAVLPAGTEMTVKIEGNTAVVDFSPEFKNYHPDDEKGILEAITFTLTEFDNIEQVKIMINGYVQETMPVQGTPINQPLSRQDGINIEVAEGTLIGNSSLVTLYFMAQNPSGQFDYFVPVTRLIPKTDDLVKATVEQLLAGPLYGSGLYSSLSNDLKLVQTALEKGTAVLQFEPSGDGEKEKLLSDQALDALVLSLTELKPIEKVQVTVAGKDEEASQPVSRPAEVNVASF